MYRIVPVSFRDNTLTVAVCDPQNLAVQDELRNFLGYDIRSVVATEREIKAALDRYYSASGESVESLVADMESDEELAKKAEAVNKEGPLDLTNIEALADSAPVRKLLNMVCCWRSRIMPATSTSSRSRTSSGSASRPTACSTRWCRRRGIWPLPLRPGEGHGRSRHRRAAAAAGRPDRADRGRAARSTCGFRSCPRMFGESVVMRILDRSVVSLDLAKVGMDACPRSKSFRQVIRSPTASSW